VAGVNSVAPVSQSVGGSRSIAGPYNATPATQEQQDYAQRRASVQQFVTQNIDNPSAVKAAMAEYNVSPAEFDQIMAYGSSPITTRNLTPEQWLAGTSKPELTATPKTTPAAAPVTPVTQPTTSQGIAAPTPGMYDPDQSASINQYVNTLDWSPENKAASSAALQQAMSTYGVDVNQLAQATGYGADSINAMFNTQPEQSQPFRQQGTQGYASGGVVTAGGSGEDFSGEDRVHGAEGLREMFNRVNDQGDGYGRGLDMSRVTPDQQAMMMREDPQAMMRGAMRFAGQPVQQTPSDEGSGYASEMKAARSEARTAQDEYNKQLREAITQREAGPSKAELYFQLAAAFGAPTKTGSFTESMGNAGAVLGAHEKATRESASAQQQRNAQFGLEAAKQRASQASADVSSVRPLLLEEMKSKRLAAIPLSEAGKTASDLGLTPGTPEFKEIITGAAQAKAEKQSAELDTKKAGVETAAAKLKLAQGQSEKLTPGEMKLKEETESGLADSTSALGMLEQALKLNPKTFGSSLGDMAQRYALETVQPDNERVKATRIQENLLKDQMITGAASRMKGVLSDSDIKLLTSVQGIGAKSQQERKEILENAISRLKTGLTRQQKRLSEVSAGKYRDTTPTVNVEGL
jgi:hypothetical protein